MAKRILLGFLGIMALAAITHLVIIFSYAITSCDFASLNGWHIVGADIIIPALGQGVWTAISSWVIVLSFMVFFAWWLPKHISFKK
ncbi:hypothetical protein FWF48_03955 [Candidatus Saccharibacteria bacterium]|nr:hypothetical protein [Candidatus Saccharibacteria bacterium]